MGRNGTGALPVCLRFGGLSMIHQYKLNGYNIVLDVYSASVHVTDDMAYDAIALLDKGDRKSTRPNSSHRSLSRMPSSA